MDEENIQEPDENSIQVTVAAETETETGREETPRESLASSPMLQNVSQSEDVRSITDDS